MTKSFACEINANTSCDWSSFQVIKFICWKDLIIEAKTVNTINYQLGMPSRQIISLLIYPLSSIYISHFSINVTGKEMVLFIQGEGS
jgi:hypothetical protein